MSKRPANTTHSATDPADLSRQVASLLQENASLKHQLDWLKNQMFGQKSEKRALIDHPDQFSLLGALGAKAAPAIAEQDDTPSPRRGTAKKQRSADCVKDTGLRFDESVPVEVIQLTPSELSGPNADQYEIIGSKSTWLGCWWISSSTTCRCIGNTNASPPQALP